MKNILSLSLLTAMIAATSAPVEAQIYKGATFIGGSLGLSQKSVQMNSMGSGANNSFAAFVNPKAGCYVTNNLAIGLGLHFGFANWEYTEPNPLYGYWPASSTQRSYTAGGSVFARYTKFIVPKLAFFTEGSIGYRYTRDETEMDYYPTYKTAMNGNGFNVTIMPGILFMPTPRLGFEVTYGRLGYDYTRSKQDNDNVFAPGIPSPVSSVSEFGVDLSSSTLTIGFNYYFGNRPRIKVEESDED